MWKKNVMKKFPRKNVSRNFRENSRSNFLRKFLDFSRNFSLKCQYKYEISEMNTRLLRRSACLCVQFFFGKIGVRLLSRRGHPRHALKNSSNNSVRTDILRRVAPGQHSAVPSGSLSRHSAGCVRLKDVRCRLKK